MKSLYVQHIKPVRTALLPLDWVFMVLNLRNANCQTQAHQPKPSGLYTLLRLRKTLHAPLILSAPLGNLTPSIVYF